MLLERDLEVPAGAADDGVGVGGEQLLGHRSRPLEDQGRVDLVVVVQQVGLDPVLVAGLAELDGVA